MKLTDTYLQAMIAKKESFGLKLMARSAFLVLLVIVSISGQEKNQSKEQIPTVAFCDLLTNAEDFEGKTIRIKATYRYGFEVSELFCLDCRDKGLVYLGFEDDFDSITKSSVRKKVKWNERGRTVNVLAVGKFYSKGGYGHMGGSPYKFVAQYFEAADIILKDAPVLLPPDVKPKATCSKVKTSR